MDIIWSDIALAAGRVLLVGAVFGAGLPALFALGLRLHAAGAGDLDGVERRPAFTVLGYVLFAIVVAAVVTGVLWITRSSLHHYLGISLFGA
ncbi:hypothetical protein QFZ53_002869 [Microbacterium natoriense]|uniref:DUF4190 domain-containing protein n=1 Tax=Microbacterium natoriense TaxID=284570 RepID=A0AAW8EYS1_9MICO|nr:hypothetical protein [Microbacterium natoriense]MDQ0648673.1 hypothetical protein [Microbacterium natoriense]